MTLRNCCSHLSLSEKGAADPSLHVAVSMGTRLSVVEGWVSIHTSPASSERLSECEESMVRRAASCAYADVNCQFFLKGNGMVKQKKFPEIRIETMQRELRSQLSTFYPGLCAVVSPITPSFAGVWRAESQIFGVAQIFWKFEFRTNVVTCRSSHTVHGTNRRVRRLKKQTARRVTPFCTRGIRSASNSIFSLEDGLRSDGSNNLWIDLEHSGEPSIFAPRIEVSR